MPRSSPLSRRGKAPGSPRRLCLISLGCSKNLVDSEVLAGFAAEAGYELTDRPSGSDVTVINTCAFIDDAVRESMEELRRLERLRLSGRIGKLVLAGCLPKRHPDILAQVTALDHLIGPGDLPALRDILSGNSAERIEVGRSRFLMNADTPRRLSTPPHMAYVKVSEGCSMACSFCTIPSIRGRQASRSMTDLVREVGRLLDQGVKEINLVGQNVTAYGRDRRDGANLPRLLSRLNDLPGDHWIRLHYLYPGMIGDDLLEIIGGSRVILPYFDLPIQHIDDGVLKRMRRRDTERSTRATIETIRSRAPGSTLRTTVIAGFPGETDAAFERLLRFVEEGSFDHLGVFAYSPEEGTPAAGLPDPVPAEAAAERRQRIMEAQRNVSRRRLKAKVGRIERMLVEGLSSESDLLLSGRLASQAAEVDGVTYLVDGDAAAGGFVQVKITRAHDYDLEAKVRSVRAGRRPPRPTPD